MQDLKNIIRREAQRVDSGIAKTCMGIVSAYDPAQYAAKVMLQPDNVETGFIPIGTPWAGNGWGLFCPPTPGDIVDVHFQDGGKDAAFVALRYYGNVFQPLSVPSGEFWLVHQSGTFLKFTNDEDATVNVTGNLNITVAGQVNLTATGKVVAQAQEFDLTGNVRVTGDIVASGDISDLLGNNGTVQHIRTVYDVHTHSDVQNGPDTTAIPNQQL